MQLQDCMAAIIDYRGKSPRKTLSGVPLITAKIVKGGRIETPDEFIDPAEYQDWMRRGGPEVGDVVITTEAPLGEIAQLTESRIALSQRIILLRGKPGILNNTYLKYLLMSDPIKRQLASRSSGTTVVGIRQSELRKVILTLPSIGEQENIAAILGSLDDKIEQNRKTGRALEEMARATFKAWFVDFEPVRAKAAGALDFPGMPAEVFAALPDRLIDSTIGPVPEGWRAGRMGDVGAQRRHQILPTEVDAETPYVGLEHMPRRSYFLAEWSTAARVTSSKFSFFRRDILFGKLRPYFHKVAPAPFDGICSTDIVALYPKLEEYAAWLLMLTSSDEFIAYTDRSSAGTKMPRTNWSDMSNFAAAVPPTEFATAFQQRTGPMLEMIESSIHESRTLALLRDYLLPRLLSGRARITIPDEEPSV